MLTLSGSHLEIAAKIHKASGCGQGPTTGFLMLGMKQNWDPITSETHCHALGKGEGELFFNNSFLPCSTMKLSLDFTMKVKPFATINKTTSLNKHQENCGLN